MKGSEFRQALEDANLTQQAFANFMGVDRTVMTRVFKAKDVKPYWLYALAGLKAIEQAKSLVMLSP